MVVSLLLYLLPLEKLSEYLMYFLYSCQTPLPLSLGSYRD